MKPARKGLGHWRQVLPSVIFFAALSGGAWAQEQPVDLLQKTQFVDDIGASERIDYSGKLRMLSQRIAADACYFTAGVDRARSGDELASTSELFQQIITALEFGDVSLNIIGEESRGRTRRVLANLHAEWDPMLEKAHEIEASGGSVEDVAVIAHESDAVLEQAKLLVVEISGQYSNPAALLQADALLIDIAGRQRMISQRISKNVCLIAMGVDTQNAQAQLASAAEMFDTTLHALRDGLEQVGIKPPPNAEIAAGLDVVLENWKDLKPIVDLALAGGVVDEEQRSIMFTGANQMTANMNAVVGLYSEASKLGL